MQIILTNKGHELQMAAQINHRRLISWVLCRAADRWMDDRVKQVLSWKDTDLNSSGLFIWSCHGFHYSECQPCLCGARQSLIASCTDTALTSKLISGIQNGSPYPSTLSCSYSKPWEIWRGLIHSGSFNMVLRANSREQACVFFFLSSFWVRVSLCVSLSKDNPEKNAYPRDEFRVGFCMWDCMHHVWLD